MSKWYIYLISSGNRTYIGSSTDPIRRLRQHNGEIRGGARATRGRKWSLEIVIGAFSGRSEACRWEKIVKSRFRGYTRRMDALIGLCWGECPSYKGRPQYIVPEGIKPFFLEEGK